MKEKKIRRGERTSPSTFLDRSEFSLKYWFFSLVLDLQFFKVARYRLNCFSEFLPILSLICLRASKSFWSDFNQNPLPPLGSEKSGLFSNDEARYTSSSPSFSMCFVFFTGFNRSVSMLTFRRPAQENAMCYKPIS